MSTEILYIGLLCDLSTSKYQLLFPTGTHLLRGRICSSVGVGGAIAGACSAGALTLTSAIVSAQSHSLEDVYTEKETLDVSRCSGVNQLCIRSRKMTLRSYYSGDQQMLSTLESTEVNSWKRRQNAMTKTQSLNRNCQAILDKMQG
ncbi:hypothetical protein Tco_0208495 [Tanacetum coccineum]